MDQISILQWNSQSIRSKKTELVHLISKFCPSIIAVSETWLKPDIRFRISGYSCLRDDRIDGYAGSALLIRRSLPFSQIPIPPHSSDINIVAVRSFDITFLSLYIPHPHSSLIPDILVIISSVPSPIILMGDFNAHHRSWGASHDDLFGLSLLEILDDANLCVLNDGSPTRRVYPNQNPKSAVDLTICSPSISSVISWSLLNSTYGSDHYPIIVQISRRATPSVNFCPSLKHRLTDANWTSFSSNLESNIDSLVPPNPCNVFECYSKFIDAIKSAADNIFPLKKPYNFKVSTPWWDAECTAAIKERKESEKRYNTSMTLENFLMFQKSAARAKRLLSKKKKMGWFNYCEGLSPRTPASIIWKQIKRYRGSCNFENVTVNDPSSWVDAFCDKLSPSIVPNQDLLPSLPYPLTSQEGLNANFSFSELQSALDGLIDSSPGQDGIPYSFLKNATDKSKSYYLQIVNLFYEYGVIPEPWKTQVIIPILKPGKNPSDPNSRRPIALSTVLVKVMEHMIKHRLEWFLENGGILAKSQYGFRKGMSTYDSLGILTSDIRLSFLNKENLVGVFLDIEAAYDNVQLPLLRQKLIRVRIPEKMTRFVCNLLSERTILIKNLNKYCSPRTVWKGLPQGSVLSPLLFSLFTYDLEQAVEPFCSILQYADDIALYVCENSMVNASSRLNSALDYLSVWLTEHGLSLSVPKSSAIIFTKKRLLPCLRLQVNGEVIPVVKKVKFLGIWLDYKLSGMPHFEHIAQKCEKNINIIRSLSGVWWGAHPFTQKLLYNAIIRSHMDYGTFLLDPCNKGALKLIEKIQSKCLRIIIGAMKSSPINAMQVECVDPPLKLRRQYLSDKFMYKLLQNSNHPLIPKLTLLSNRFDAIGYRSIADLPCILHSFIKFTRLPHPVAQYPLNPLYSTPYNALVFKPSIITDFGIDKNSTEASKVFLEKVNLDYNGWLYVFTDASKLSDGCPVGTAVWIPKFKIILSFKCPSVTSVFTGESVAILEAILYAKSHNIYKTIIFTDSKSCLQAILVNPFRDKSRFPIILRIREALFECHQIGIQIVLAWIPGHSGIPGNENADACAKHAVQVGSVEYFKIYCHDLVPISKIHLVSSWSTAWKISSTVKGKYYGSIQPDIPNKPWFFKFRAANKTVTSTICRLRLGHVCTPAFLAKIRIRDHSLCECGLDEGTVDHIFFNCQKFFSLYNFIPPEIPRPFSFRCILSLAFTPLVNLLCKYLSKYKIRL